MEENTALAPGLLVINQFKFLSAPRMIRMANAESLFFSVT